MLCFNNRTEVYWFFNQINVDNITIDFDSTVITRYGEQQGSAKGYNPNKKVLKISLHSKRRPWLDGIFSQIKNTSPPFNYSFA